MTIKNLSEELSGCAYPGRGIVAGMSEDGKKAVSAYLFAISDDFLSLILFTVKAEYFIDEACILKIHDMWRHHFERFQLFVVEREYLHDADHLGAGIIAAEACHFYQVELVVVEACFLHLII